MTKKHQFRVTHLLLVVLCFYTATCFAAPEDHVKLSVVALNPSSSKKIQTKVSQNLPLEIRPEDVLDAAGMLVKFNDQARTYYVEQEVELEPKEAKTITIKLKNIWLVTEEDIGQLQELLTKSVKALNGTPYEQTAKLMQDKVSEKLGQISDEQSKDLSIQKRIELYRAHVKLIENIKQDILSISAIREMQKEKEEGERTAKFVIYAENPSEESRKMTVRAVLPQEIVASDVVEKADFLLLYDEPRKRFAVEKQDTLGGKEKKKYEVVLRDIWFVRKQELDFLLEQTGKLIEHLQGTSFETYVLQQEALIKAKISEIEESQNEVKDSENINDRIQAYEINKEKLGFIQKKIKELQDLLLEIPIKKQLSQIEKIKQAIKKISKVFEILQLGFQPNLSTTWWLIMGIVAFLAIMSVVFYTTWLSKLKDAKSLKGKKGKETGKPVETPKAS